MLGIHNKEYTLPQLSADLKLQITWNSNDTMYIWITFRDINPKEIRDTPLTVLYHDLDGGRGLSGHMKSPSPVTQIRVRNWKLSPRHMLWVLKRTVSMRRFFEHPEHMFKLMDKKIITFLRKLFFLNWLYALDKWHFCKWGKFFRFLPGWCTLERYAAAQGRSYVYA